MRKTAALVFLWAHIVGVMTALLVSNVAPSKLGTQLGVVGGAVLALGWVAYVELADRKRMADTPRWIRWPLVACFGFAMAYMTLAWAFCWFFTIAVGHPGEEFYAVTYWHSGTRRACARPDVGHGLFVDAPNAFCVPRSAKDQLRPGRLIRVEGRASILGMNTERIYPLDTVPLPGQPSKVTFP